MGEFTLDTAGVVVVPTCDPAYIGERWMRWPDLSPFEQGYVEAALVDFGHFSVDDIGCQCVHFRDLAPETLAAMLRDCEAWRRLYPKCGDAPADGAKFWELRTLQLVERPDFPPLTLHLGDDGKIYLREGQS